MAMKPHETLKFHCTRYAGEHGHEHGHGHGIIKMQGKNSIRHENKQDTRLSEKERCLGLQCGTPP